MPELKPRPHWLEAKALSHPTPRAVTKISSCQVNTTSRRGIKHLGISFGPIFLLFSYESNMGPRSK